ncbi:MAG: putative sulfate exporter family transporter [Sebaldella sp.]|nr:putative sulfate exporter family transporter [Sebaldella sp.]
MNKAYGILLSIIIAIISTIVGKKFEIIGAPIISIIIGILINNFMTVSQKFRPGIKFTSKYILQASIVILGFTLNFHQVKEVGTSSFIVTISTIIVAFLGAVIIGRLLKVDSDLISLIGSGTAICGGSAIAAISSIIDPDEHDLAYAMSTIFLFNVIAAILFPILGHIMHMSNETFGLWAGTAINDTSSVVAAGYAYSKSAGDFATIVKLSRATLIIPISFVFAILKIIEKRSKNKGEKINIKISKIFPWFILLFLIASIIETILNFPVEIKTLFSETAKFMIAMALASVGLSADFKKMFHSGIKPILLGFYLWVLVSVTSLIAQYFF